VSRTAVVTGGASGVGRSIAAHLARAGHAVAVMDLDGAAATSTAEQLGDEGAHAMGCQVDVADRASVEAAYAEVRSQLGPIEIVVTSAAISGFVRFQDITAEDWQRTLDVNLTGTFHCIQAAIDDMVTGRWGRIVTISSAAGQTASPRQAHYSASKGGVIAMTKTIAAEFARKGITANTVPPFTVDTPMLRTAQASGDLPSTDLIERMVPAGRLGTGDDIGAACAFLCSEEAGYITGQVIAPNGGAVI
jgi:2-hydroxycyclohexanecarboxyl-CoA dehydrogenase